MSHIWPTIEETQENLRQELRGRSSGSCEPYTSSRLKVGRFVTVDCEVELVYIGRGWEKETLSWMAKVYPIHGEVLASIAQLEKVK